MKLKPTLFALAICLFAGSVLAVPQTYTQLSTYIQANFTSNNQGLITGAKLNTFLQNFVDSLMSPNSLGGDLQGALPNPTLSSGAALSNIGSQTGNKVLASPSGTSGLMSPRALVALDLPPVPFTGLTGNISVSQMDGGIGATAANCWKGDGHWADCNAGVPGGGTVTSVGETFTGGLISVSGSPITAAGTFGLTVAGTSGGIPYFNSASSWTSSGVLGANLPIIGGGAGVAPSTGTRSGNTTAFVTTTGAQTSGNCVSIDASGNHIASGAGCGGGGNVTRQQFTVSGTYTPNANLVKALVTCYGGGGAGGGVAGATGKTIGAGGGGAGAWSKVLLTSAQIGASKAVTIGAAGAPGAAGFNSGGSGGNTDLGTNLCKAAGGAGGSGANGTIVANLGGAGGLAAIGNGDLKLDGQKGQMGSGAFITTVILLSGDGGSSPVGFGGRGFNAGSGSCTAGTAGTGYGSGGSGAQCDNTTATTAGEAGTAGFVEILEFNSQ